jgi:CubicO group peptidase (beta-lactamase class C family)
MHTGYTGTCICIDPVNRLYSVILTNRYVSVSCFCEFDART